MRIDSCLLAWCAAGADRAVFRAYGWARPTLSLGRAEPFPDGWGAAALEAAGVDVVRRPTGGDAVLHDGELAFAAAASLPGPWALSPRGFAHLVADAVAEAMRRLGFDAARVGEEDRARSGGGADDASASTPTVPGARPCFARSEPGEVRAGGFKVAGIASRFTRGAALSHASIPLSPRHREVASFRRDGGLWRDVLEGHARSVAELPGHGPLTEGLAEALGREIAGAFGSRLGRVLEPAAFADAGLDPSCDADGAAR